MRKFHKGWLMLALIVLSVLACLGFGRFSFGAILPFMKDGLDFSYQQTGFIASSIFLGYLLAVFTVGYFVIRFTAKRVIITSLALISFGMLITANANGFGSAYIGCFLIGLGTGGTYIPSVGLLGQWFAPKKRGMAIGTAMGGAGMGMVFSGLFVPVLIHLDAENGWRISWYVLGGLIIAIAIVNSLFLKNRPEQLGLNPIGEQPLAKKIATEIAATTESQVETTSKSVYRNKIVWLTGIVYFFWGMSYLIYSTFLVDYLITDLNFSNAQAGRYFAIGGFASVVSGFIWGSVSDRIGRMKALIIVFSIEFLVLLSLSFTTSSVLILLLVLTYGLTLWGAPTIINASVSDHVSMTYIPVATGFVTVFFSLGQFFSPMITGSLIDYYQNYLSALIFSSITALGCIIFTIIIFYMSRKKVKSGVLTSS